MRENGCIHNRVRGLRLFFHFGSFLVLFLELSSGWLNLRVSGEGFV